MSVRFEKVPNEATPLKSASAESGASGSESDSNSIKLKKSSTMLLQQEIVDSLSMRDKLIGLVIAFLTMVALWEAVDHLVDHLARGSKNRDLLEIGIYAAMAGLGTPAVGFSVWFLEREMDDDEPTLLGSTLVAISTLICASGTWGALAGVVKLFIPKAARIWFWATCGGMFLAMSIFYSFRTKHVALLDIASCATSLGVYDTREQRQSSMYIL